MVRYGCVDFFCRSASASMNPKTFLRLITIKYIGEAMWILSEATWILLIPQASTKPGGHRTNLFANLWFCERVGIFVHFGP